MTRDDDLLRLGLTKITDRSSLISEAGLLHSGFPNCASHDSASDLATIANTWTVAPETS